MNPNNIIVTNEVPKCNIITLAGKKCLRKKTIDSEFCSFHLKREQNAGPRVPGLCIHIFKNIRCSLPRLGVPLCLKHFGLYCRAIEKLPEDPEDS